MQLFFIGFLFQGNIKVLFSFQYFNMFYYVHREAGHDCQSCLEAYYGCVYREIVYERD